MINDEMQNNKITYKTGIFDPKGKYVNPLNDKPYSDNYKTLAKFWSNLPAYKMGKQIVESVLKNDVILIESATGSGKSLLINKFCLHSLNYKGFVVMTLPKKLVTLSSASFAAKTMDVELGEQIGYQYRGENVKSKNTVLLFSTDGSIVSMLKSDPLLREIDILLIDEAHERKIQIDLLLYLVKNAIKIRKERNMKPLKLVIMSATINEPLFKAYYREFNYEYIFLSGKPNYPIESIYLENKLIISKKEYLTEGVNIITNIIKNINDIENNKNKKNKKFIEGDILFFVCTISECNEMALKISEIIKDAFVMPLYSGFNQELEQYISNPNKYKELNPNYKRRIFVSTNVAESSITIDGIIYVIDSGLEMNVKYDPDKKCNIMTKNIITKSQMIQRKGRAGRTNNGFCYHLYTVEEESKAKDYPDPEILKEDIKNVCLSLIKLGCQINKTDFTVSDTIKMLSDFIQSPYEKFITDSFDFLINNGLIIDSKLSKIGRLIVESRLDVVDGLSLLYAHNISNLVFKKVFKIICIQSFLKHGTNDFFNKDIDKNKINKILGQISIDCYDSEHVLLYKLFKYIKKHKEDGFFNIKLVDNISHIYNSQLSKMEKIFRRYNYILEDIVKKDMTINIICSFNFGLKSNRAFRNNNMFKYNNMNCELSKSYFKFDKYSSIVFYSNLLINGKLNVSIVSPFLL